MYLLTIIMILAATCLIAVGCGMKIGIFIDMPSLILICMVTIPVLLGAGVHKDVNRAFRMMLTGKWNATIQELKRAEHGISILMVSLLTSGAFISGCSFLGFLLQTAKEEPAPDSQRLYAGLAVSMLALFYSLILQLVLIPVKSRITQHIIDYMGQDL